MLLFSVIEFMHKLFMGTPTHILFPGIIKGTVAIKEKRLIVVQKTHFAIRFHLHLHKSYLIGLITKWADVNVIVASFYYQFPGSRGAKNVDFCQQFHH